MKTPLMGGKSIINILIQGDDVVNSLLSLSSNHRENVTFLEELITEKYQDTFKLKIHSQIGDRSDILLQQVKQISPPHQIEFFQENFPQFYDEQKLKELDIIVFSILPEIQQKVYQHRETGYLIAPPLDWQETWHQEKKEQFINNFELTLSLTPDQSQENFSKIIKYLKEKTEAYIIFYNACTVDPNDLIHNYYQKQDPLSLKLKKLNLALLKLSLEEGISIINVDQILAELGANQYLSKILEYTPQGYQLIAQEFLRVIEDVGFLENRPLLVQMGNGRK